MTESDKAESVAPLETHAAPSGVPTVERGDRVEEGSEDATKISRKVDPASLQMRAQPVPALRIRREVIIGVSAVASCVLAATAWWALKPDGRNSQPIIVDGAGGARLPSDALSGVPKSYDAVPQLGPGLPGDLGRPILKRQRELSAGATVEDRANEQAARDAEAARARAESELRAARQSALLATTSALAPSSTSEAGKTAYVSDPSAPGATVPDAIDPDRDPNAQEHKVRFMAATDKDSVVNPHLLEPPVSPNIVSAGSVIAASLITGLRSDLPGLVSAQVSERVYDSATGRILLIPQGARLIGKYDSGVAYGQSRALIAWQRIIMPDGSSIRLDNAPATDAAGYAGVTGRVDNHTGRLLKGVAISTLLGVGTNLTFSGESDLVQAIREATQQSGARAGDQITQRNLQVQPTITIRPGTPVRLLVHRDLILSPWQI